MLRAKLARPWLRRELKLGQRRIVKVMNANADENLANVQGDVWIIPWSQFADQELSSIVYLCSKPVLRSYTETCKNLDMPKSSVRVFADLADRFRHRGFHRLDV